MANTFNRTRLDRVLKALPEAAKTELKGSLDKAADLVVSTQKQFVPVEDATLASTIRHAPVSEEEGKIAVRIEAGGPKTTKPVRDGQSATYDYALGIEFGTQEMKAQPFFFSGYRAVRKRVKSRISRAIKKAVKQAAAQ